MQFAITLEKNNPEYHDKYGSVLLAYGNVEGAIRELTAAAQLNPESRGVMLRLGNTFNQKGDTARALEQYKKFLQRDSMSYDAKQIHVWIRQSGN